VFRTAPVHNQPPTERGPSITSPDVKSSKCEDDHSPVPCAQINPYPTAFPYEKGMVLHFYQQQESSTTKTVHRVINKGLKAYV